MPDILGLHNAVRYDTSFRKLSLFLTCVLVLRFYLQVRCKREVKKARQQKSLRHLTLLEQQRAAYNPLSSIRKVYNQMDTSKAMHQGQCAVTHTIQVHYSNSSFINNADYKLLRENTSCRAYNIWV